MFSRDAEPFWRGLAIIGFIVLLTVLAVTCGTQQDQQDAREHAGCTKVEIHDAPGYGGRPWFWQCPQGGK